MFCNKLSLQFIGQTGSMGLINGVYYFVKIKNDHRYIIVDWGTGRCPYSSPAKFAENWSV